ncbi:hypothetical protein ACO0LM_11995 [Undibacterium sp. Di26W]|uniref:hypothetical protein n=1 Tax=Undibacterium sp. Di26W TaxID=3413035 RepID=UPI003BF4538C
MLLLKMLNNLFNPTLTRIAEVDLERAEMELLEVTTVCEDFRAHKQALEGRIARLKAHLADPTKFITFERK